tara:strand:+ start:53 stop:790 length:738 start_codon:yes stop_codon:yes gene_type:complete
MATIAEILSYNDKDSPEELYKYLTDLLYKQDSDFLSGIESDDDKKTLMDFFSDLGYSDYEYEPSLKEKIEQFSSGTDEESAESLPWSQDLRVHKEQGRFDDDVFSSSIGKSLMNLFRDDTISSGWKYKITPSQVKTLFDSLIAGQDLIGDKVKDFDYQGQVGDVEASKERDIRDIQNAYATSELKNRYQRLTGQDLTSPSSSKTGRESYVDALAGIERGAESDIDKINRALKSSFYSGVEEWQNL